MASAYVCENESSFIPIHTDVCERTGEDQPNPYNDIYSGNSLNICIYV